MRMPMMMDMPMMMHAGPAMLLRIREPLGLSADQVQRLEAIQRQADAAHRQHLEAAMPAMHQAMTGMDGDSPDLARIETAMRQGAEHHVAAHMAMVRAMVEARAVLTAEQRARLHAAMGMMHEMMRDHHPMGEMRPGGMMTHPGAHPAPGDSAQHRH
jgi:Spy/CpxP family protein refolding chaperone